MKAKASVSYKNIHSQGRKEPSCENGYFNKAPRISGQYECLEHGQGNIDNKYDTSMTFQNDLSLEEKFLKRIEVLEQELSKYKELEQKSTEVVTSNQKLSYLLKKTQQKVYSLEKKLKSSESKRGKLKEALQNSDQEKDQIWEKWVKLNTKYKSEILKREK